jgi:hypothetical protein
MESRMNKPSTLMLHDLDDRRVLAFDLRDILRALAPSSLKARWMLISPNESSFEAMGKGGLRLEALADRSIEIGGDELLAITDDTVQVIWGEFVGVLPEGADRQWLTVRAFDSSFYEITTSDQVSIAKIKARFRDVRCP